MRIQNKVAVGAILITSAAYPALASDTVAYSYDVLGRLTTATVSGGPNSGVTAGTAFDSAGNRASYTVSGAGSFRRASTPTSAMQKPEQPIPEFKLYDK